MWSLIVSVESIPYSYPQIAWGDLTLKGKKYKGTVLLYHPCSMLPPPSSRKLESPS